MATCTVKDIIPSPPPKRYVLEMSEREANVVKAALRVMSDSGDAGILARSLQTTLNRAGIGASGGLLSFDSLSTVAWGREADRVLSVWNH